MLDHLYSNNPPQRGGPPNEQPHVTSPFAFIYRRNISNADLAGIRWTVCVFFCPLLLLLLKGIVWLTRARINIYKNVNHEGARKNTHTRVIGEYVKCIVVAIQYVRNTPAMVFPYNVSIRSSPSVMLTD